MAGATRLEAMGRMFSKRSTARSVTTSKRVWLREVSARTFSISTSVNVRARLTSRRNAAFLWFDSMSVREICGAQSFMGRPGKPAPEPRSATLVLALVLPSVRSALTGEAPVATGRFPGNK